MNSRSLVIVLLVVVGVVVLLPLAWMLIWGGMSGTMMGHGSMGPGMMRGGWSGFGGMGLLVALLLAAGVILLVFGFTRREVGVEEPVEILRRRLARGEITPEQYEQVQRTLRGT